MLVFPSMLARVVSDQDASPSLVVSSGHEHPFRYFNSSPYVIRLVVMMYVRYPLSFHDVADLLAERGIDVSQETVWFWWNRFGRMFAAEIRKRRVMQMRGYPQWRWHLDEVFGPLGRSRQSLSPYLECGSQSFDFHASGGFCGLHLPNYSRAASHRVH